jgi:putative oxidoreductase
MQSAPQDLTALIGRVLVVILFLFSGWGKFSGLEGTAAYIASKNLPMPMVLAVASGVVELAATILVIIGYRARWAALVLAIFTIMAALLFHNYWTIEDAAARSEQYLNFWKNVGIMGGLLMLVAFGPGRYSVDGRSAPNA